VSASKRYEGYERRKHCFTYEDGVTLEKYVDTRIEGIEKSIEVAHDNLKAKMLKDNEIREQLRAQSSTFVTRIEHNNLEKNVRDLRDFMKTLEGKASQSSVNFAYALGAISLFSSVLSLLAKVASK
jgi:hypothetical protein